MTTLRVTTLRLSAGIAVIAASICACATGEKPELEVNPAEGPPETTVTLVARNLSPGEQIEFKEMKGPQKVVVRADTNGVARAHMVAVPEGDARVVYYARTSPDEDVSQVLKGEFKVTGE